MVGIFKGKSYYQAEKDKLQEKIELPLLELVLQHLPHLQVGKEQQDNVWEIIAIKINTILISENVASINEVPTLNGMFMKEVFENLMAPFVEKFRVLVGNNPLILDYEQIKRNIVTRSGLILYELYLLRSYDIEVTAKLAKENYEAQRRLLFEQSMDPTSNGYDPAKLLQKFQQSQENVKLQVFEEELEKKNKKLLQLQEENKQLLELNHELLRSKK